MEKEYRQKYFGRFKDISNKIIKVEIYEHNYVGIAKELEFVANPISIITPKRKTFDPILSSGAKIKVVVKNDGDYRDLFNVPRKTHRVLIKRDNDIIFNGFIEPELYEENFIAPPYILTIPCVDGLKLLKDVSPGIVKNTSLTSLIKIICSCLQKSGIELDLYVNCSMFYFERGRLISQFEKRTEEEKKQISLNRIYPQSLYDKGLEDMTKQERFLYQITTFEETFIEPYLFEHMKDKEGVVFEDCYSILKDILTSFYCRLYQDGKSYRIERVKDKLRDYPLTKWVHYNLSGINKGSIYEDNTLTIGDLDNYPWINASQKLSVESPCSEQKLKIDYKKYDSLVFNNFDKGILSNEWKYNVPDSCYYRWSMKPNAKRSYTYFVNQHGITKGVKFNVLPEVKNEPLFQKAYFTTAKIRNKYKPDRFNVTFKIFCDKAELNNDDKVKVRFGFQFSSDFYIVRNKDSNTDDKYTLFCSGTPSSEEAFKKIRNNTINEVEIEGNDFDENGVYNCSISFDFHGLGDLLSITPYFPSTTDPYNVFVLVNGTYSCQLLLYPPIKDDEYNSKWVTNIGFGDIKVTVDETTNYDNEFTAYINLNYHKKAPDLKIRFINSQGLSWFNRVINQNFKNDLFMFPDYASKASNGAVGWIDIDEYNRGKTSGGEIGSETLIQEKLLKDSSDLFVDPRQKVKGTLFTAKDPISLKNNIKVKHTTGTFMIVGKTYNVSECQYDLDLEEIKKDLTILG